MKWNAVLCINLGACIWWEGSTYSLKYDKLTESKALTTPINLKYAEVDAILKSFLSRL